MQHLLSSHLIENANHASACEMNSSDEASSATASSEAADIAAVANGAEDVTREDDITNVSNQDTTIASVDNAPPEASQHHSLRHHLLGPSLTKAGQDDV